MEDFARLAYRPESAAKKLDIGRTSIFGLIASGELETIKIGRSRLIPAAALDRFISRLIAAQSSGTEGCVAAARPVSRTVARKPAGAETP